MKDVPPDIALCTCAKSGGRTSHSKFQVEVLRTLTKGAKISSDFQAQSCHCHVTIIVLVSTTCHPGRVVLLLWKCGETQGVSDFGWNEVEHESGSGGCFPPTLAQLLYEQSFISNAWCILVLCLEATRLRQSERPKVARHIRLLNSLPVDGAQ